ncbi:MAG: CesT family type III secretion system chaperone [Candidatus Algichlamydia australiensis]|nr:CesT family type III secretion system chaperone [Chlamydiales bacterium]
MDRFQTIIQELSQELATPLKATGDSTCAITFKNSLFTQIELSENQEKLVIICVIEKLPPGKYREQVLTAALQENALSSPLIGSLSFSRRSDELLLYASTPMAELNGKKLFEILLVLVDKAHRWQEAIQQNLPLPVDLGT